MESLLTASGVELARRIRARDVSSREVVEAHLAWLAAVNPALNAVVAGRREVALAEADRADRALADGDPAALGPFHGVPCTIKECFALEGMPWTAGLKARAGTLAPSDATTVARMRRAGAIPLGVTNTSELCMWLESNNRVYGRSNNPYDPRRIVGGSSGGEGAIVGSGASPFGLGSDIGGSIRLPAFFNGVFGHKPTGGLVPGTGQYPMAEDEALRYLTTGPLARRAEDLWPLLQVLAGPDGEDEGCLPWALGDPDTVDLSRLRVLHIPDNGAVRVSRELREAQARAADALAALGATVVEARVPGLRRSFDIWSSMLGTAGQTKFATLLANGGRFRFWRELVKWLFRRSDHTLPAIMLAGTERITELSPKRTRRFIAMGRELRDELAGLLGDDGVMLYPSYTRVAPRHYRPLLGIFDWTYTAILNVMEVPSTQVPLGLGPRSCLPVGVQVAAGHGRDHVTVAVARALEGAFGGWVPPWRVGRLPAPSPRLPAPAPRLPAPAAA